jgi:omega-6 fatty acid desaturase (delta-12 desaturase)
MARSDAAPYPAALTHLRPTDAAGLRVVGMAAAGTALGCLLSFAGGFAMWLCGQVLLAVMLVQWFVILHECGHDTLFRTRRWHAVAGRVAAVFSLIPYHSWTRVHGRHHKWTGWQDLDPTTESLVPRPRGRAQRALVNVCWRLWIPIFSIVYRVTNYWNIARLFRMFPKPADRRAIARDAAWLVALYGLGVFALGPALALRGAGLALAISFVIEDLLLLSQHTHVPQQVSGGSHVKPFPAVEQEPFTRSLRLPRIASAFVLHFDAHELHHMYPFVPGYHLRRIPYTPENEIGWWHWVRGAKRVPADVLLFQNRLETGHDL